MKKLRSNLAVKLLAVLLCVACTVGALYGAIIEIVYWEAKVSQTEYVNTTAYYNALQSMEYQVETLLNYEETLAEKGSLNYLENQRYQEVKQALDPANTNFRYLVRKESTGEILYASALEAPFEHVSQYYTFYNEYSDERDFLYECGADETLPLEDEFWEIKQNFEKRRNPGTVDSWVTVTLGLGAAVLFAFLSYGAGHKKGVEGIHLNWQDRIPLDLYLVAAGCGAVVLVWLAEESWRGYDAFAMRGDSGIPAEVFLWLLAACVGGICALLLAVLLTVATRCKSHTFWRNTLVWRVLRRCGRLLQRLGNWWSAIFGSWPITRRTVLLFLAYLAGTVLTTLTIVLIPFYQGFVLFVLCRWVKEWKAVRMGTQAIVGGTPDTVIVTTGMRRFPDLREHAEQLNDLGGAINSAVEERMKSERMKAELITNVSHDLKTPLTSIINYVDLLKKEELPDGKAQEYVEVLDRKSQRLKKLTEDLVEASKASTGTLAVERERLDFGQLARQAVGEYEEKLTARKLTLVAELPEEPLNVLADGRHLWRVLDNLLGNCVKYAMEGTRVYLSLAKWDGAALLTLKNISDQSLNVPADQLMERFVRGDESRTTEGSGLGLSIARSLTELQGGTFGLSVDGDLFKVTVRVPLAGNAA